MVSRMVSLDYLLETEYITSSEDEDDYKGYEDYEEHSLLLHTSDNRQGQRSGTPQQLGLKGELASTWLELPTLPDVEGDVESTINASNHERFTNRVKNNANDRPEFLLLRDLVEGGSNCDEDEGYNGSEFSDDLDFSFEKVRVENTNAKSETDDFRAATEQAADTVEGTISEEGTTNTTICGTTGCENVCFKCDEYTRFELEKDTETNKRLENEELLAIWSLAIQTRFLGPQQKFTKSQILERIQRCKTCHLKFTSRKEALKHHNVVHDEKLCPACLLYFPTKQLTTRLHFIQCHAENRKNESAECPVLGCRKTFYPGLYHHLGKAHLCEYEKRLKAKVLAEAQKRQNKLNRKFKRARLALKPQSTYRNRYDNIQIIQNKGNGGAFIERKNVSVKEPPRSTSNGKPGVSGYAKEWQKQIGMIENPKNTTDHLDAAIHQSAENFVAEATPTFELETAVTTSNNLVGFQRSLTPNNIISKTSLLKSKQLRPLTNFKPKMRGVNPGYLDFCTQDPKQWVESELKRRASNLADPSFVKKTKQNL